MRCRQAGSPIVCAATSSGASWTALSRRRCLGRRADSAQTRHSSWQCWSTRSTPGLRTPTRRTHGKIQEHQRRVLEEPKPYRGELKDLQALLRKVQQHMPHAGE
mmetsp:Transcript_84932/g.245562  ORF Transcript_84932/g.245562 Transcript_84932/m.245562 type:complete len:104 (-) Transcript_84932:137-448(-)